MPAIHLFNRKSLSGGDDLQLPCLLAIELRCIQLLGLSIPVWWHLSYEASQMGGWFHYILYDPSQDATCRHSHLFPLLLVTYATASTLLILVGLVLEVRLLIVTSSGTPTEAGNRSHVVQNLLEFKLVPFSIAQALIVLLGICAVCGFSHYHHCAYNDNDTDDFWADLNAWIEGGDIVKDEPEKSRFQSWWWVAYAILLLLQCIEVVVSAFFVTGLMRQPSLSSVGSLPHHHIHHELVEEMWVERCTNFCQCLGMSTCFFFGGREIRMGDYGDIARALADYFETGGVLDLVPSDVAAGVLVLQRMQRQRMLQARHRVRSDRLLESPSSHGEPSEALLVPYASSEPPSSDSSDSARRQTTYLMQQEGSQTFYQEESRKVLSRHKESDLETLHEGARFGRYALAIYSWPLYIYSYPVTGIPRLLCNKRGCCCSQQRLDDDYDLDGGCGIVGDNVCQMHKSALLLHAGLEDETDLVYAQLESSFSKTPYCILLDHKWKAVVVAIRGTFSLEDCVTDVLIEPESMESTGQEFGFDAMGQHCHGGVLSTARVVYRDLQRHGILDRLLVGSNAEYPDYHLRLVGHSLGAATSTVISFMLRNKFPTLRCVNFSPPGCALTWKLATDCQEFCTSFVLDCELVPRLSLESMEHLRDEVLEIIGRIQVPKVSVANEVLRGTGFWSCSLCLDGDLERDGDSLQRSLDYMLCPPDQVPQESEYQRQLHQFRSIQSDRRVRRGESRAIQMFPPGKLVHLIKTGEKTSCMHAVANCTTCCMTNFGAEYTPVWIKNDDLNEIVVSTTMATDHFPNRMSAELEGVARDYGIDLSQSRSFSMAGAGELT